MGTINAHDLPLGEQLTPTADRRRVSFAFPFPAAIAALIIVAALARAVARAICLALLNAIVITAEIIARRRPSIATRETTKEVLLGLHGEAVFFRNLKEGLGFFRGGGGGSSREEKDGNGREFHGSSSSQ